ncbi:DUF2726 domain-containing protein [Stutzerimonas azotifigens]|uniref:DUF2726 domain-containing protein n=1 Tax=Stutzerimonas azotifigens TaxID=291995 RepID=UPI0004089FB4|nr:DUF2726 domain-containing protein [Stutzerimonas azotifigens]
MSWLAVMLAAFACFVLVFLIKQRQFSHPAVQFPYALKNEPFDEHERQLLDMLQQTVGERFLVLAKVRVLDVLDITALPRRSAWYHANNQVSGRRFDFLLIERGRLRPACAVTLDRGSDARDDFLAELCQRIGLPHVSLTPQQAQAYAVVRESIERALT